MRRTRNMLTNQDFEDAGAQFVTGFKGTGEVIVGSNNDEWGF